MCFKKRFTNRNEGGLPDLQREHIPQFRVLSCWQRQVISKIHFFVGAVLKNKASLCLYLLIFIIYLSFQNGLYKLTL